MMSTQRSIFAWIRAGLGTTLRHKRLVLAFYLVPLLPALLWAWVTSFHIHEAMDDRPFAQQLLGGNAWGVMQDFVGSDESHLGVVFGALPALLIVSLLLQIALAAGTTSVLAGKGGDSPFFTGVGRFTGRYCRSLLAFLSTLVPALFVVIIASGIGGKLAEKNYDERFQYGAVVVGLLVFLCLFALLDLAYDLSRLSAADHDSRRTLRGYYRALWAVVRRPFKLIPFYLLLLVLLAVVLWLVYTLRGGVVITSAGTLLAVFVLQQLGMLVRAFWQVSFWGAELALYRDLGSPDWCGVPQPRRTAPIVAEVTTEAPTTPAPSGSLSTVAPRAPVETTPLRTVTAEEVEEGERQRE